MAAQVLRLSSSLAVLSLLCGCQSMLAAPPAALQPKTATVTAGQQVNASRVPNERMLTFTACKQWIEDSAKPYAPVAVQTVMTGPVQRPYGGKRIATLFVRIVFDRHGGPETRKNHIECTIDANGKVIAFADASL